MEKKFRDMRDLVIPFERHLSFVCRQIYVVAGQGQQRIAFLVTWSTAMSIIEVYGGWLRDDGNLYFEDWDPAVVKGVLFGRLSMKRGESALFSRCPFWAQNKDGNYFAKFYVLAAALE